MGDARRGGELGDARWGDGVLGAEVAMNIR